MGPITNVMLTKWRGAMGRSRTAIFLAVIAFSSPAVAQQALLGPMQPASMEPLPMTTLFQSVSIPEATSHRFWDRENSLLFATNVAFSTADFVVTRNNLRNGGQELNPVTSIFAGSTAGLAVNFVGENAGVIGLSYYFHKTGHHKLERMVSMLNIGSSAAAVTFDLARR